MSTYLALSLSLFLSLSLSRERVESRERERALYEPRVRYYRAGRSKFLAINWYILFNSIRPIIIVRSVWCMRACQQTPSRPVNFPARFASRDPGPLEVLPLSLSLRTVVVVALFHSDGRDAAAQDFEWGGVTELDDGHSLGRAAFLQQVSVVVSRNR